MRNYKMSLLLSTLYVFWMLAWVLPASSQAVPAQAGAGPPLVTLDVTDAPLRTVLSTLFNGSGKMYIVGTFSTDKVTLHIHAVPFQIALAALLTAAKPPLGYEIADDGTYCFEHLSSREAGVVGDPARSPVNFDTHMYRIPLDHVPAQYILDTMRTAMTGGLQLVDWQSSPLASEINYIIIDKKSNCILVASTVDGFNFFKEIVRNLDQTAPPPKVKAHK